VIKVYNILCPKSIAKKKDMHR